MLYILIKCIHGKITNSIIPKDIQERLKEKQRGHYRTKRSLEENFFYDISRSEYTKILFQSI